MIMTGFEKAQSTHSLLSTPRPRLLKKETGKRCYLLIFFFAKNLLIEPCVLQNIRELDAIWEESGNRENFIIVQFNTRRVKSIFPPF